MVILTDEVERNLLTGGCAYYGLSPFLNYGSGMDFRGPHAFCFFLHVAPVKIHTRVSAMHLGGGVSSTVCCRMCCCKIHVTSKKKKKT